MRRAITQRELRNESGEIMRRLDEGESFEVTRNGVPVAELTPIRRRTFIPAGAFLAALSGAPAIDRRRFQEDLDRHVDQSALLRG